MNKIIERLIDENIIENNFNLPQKIKIIYIINRVLALMFPHFSDKKISKKEIKKSAINLRKEILPSIKLVIKNNSEKIVDLFLDNLYQLKQELMLDARAMFNGDPAAKSINEVILTYPGFLAIAIYRIANELYKLEIPLIPRIMTEYAHQMTGIDINPGAKIGKSFCIDHGTGIVIGETTEIGDNVKIYQGVTLGALSVEKNMASKKRHPTIEDSVVIYANATILGGETVVGRNSTIGGNVWLTKSIPSNSLVYFTSEINLRTKK